VQIRADLAARRPDMIKSAAKAGVRIAFLGIESGSDEVLKAMSKGTCTATATEGIRVLHNNGILTHGGFVIGAPYESKNQLNKTFKYADQLRSAGLDSAQFSIYTPLPGTTVFSEALRNNLLLTLDWNLYDCLHPVLKTRTKPLWLYIDSYINEHIFFLKKWISDAIIKSDSHFSNGVYSQLVQSATRFLVKNLFKYVQGLVNLPIGTVKLWTMLRKPKKLSKDILKEILNQTLSVNAKT
jgi:anaerobic magnesium-protoporphyrin IX monomethyl ester cyclase